MVIPPDTPSMVIGDPDRLRQIILNLVDNAIKFTEKGEIVVSVEWEETDGDAMFQFSVRDTGIGIPKGKMDVIFQNFKQGDGSPTRRHGGAGLGATIAKKLVDLMGGEIWLESEEGAGSCFHFRVPFTLAKKKHGQEVKKMAGVLPALRVLVVDDNESSRGMLQQILSYWGPRPSACGSGEEAVKILEEEHGKGASFDLCLIDCNLPERDGFAVYKEIKNNPDLKSLEIIMLTRMGVTEDTEKCMELGIRDFTTKPMRQSKLLQTVNETIKKIPGNFLSDEIGAGKNKFVV